MVNFYFQQPDLLCLLEINIYLVSDVDFKIIDIRLYYWDSNV